MPIHPAAAAAARFRTLSVCLCLLAAALAPRGIAAAAPNDPPEPQIMVVQYVGNEQGNNLGKKVMLVYVRPVGKKSTIPLAVPSRDEKKSDYAPIAAVADVVNDLKPNDFIAAEILPGRPRMTLKSVKLYEPKAGELVPDVYLFQNTFRKAEGSKDFIAVVLTKMGQDTTAAVPMLKNEAGGMAPDEKMIASMEKMKLNDPVEVTFSSKGRTPTIKTLDPWKAPEPATFVKLAEADHNGAKVPAVELLVAGKPVTALLSGTLAGKRWVADRALDRDVKMLEKGRLTAEKKGEPAEQPVMARVVDDGSGTMWLRKIEKAEPGDAPAADASADAATDATATEKPDAKDAKDAKPDGKDDAKDGKDDAKDGKDDAKGANEAKDAKDKK